MVMRMKKTNEYWRKRLERDEAKAQAIASRYSQKQYKFYSSAARRINNRINSLYAEIQNKGIEEVNASQLYLLKQWGELRKQIYDECFALGVKGITITDEALNKVFETAELIEGRQLSLTPKNAAEKLINSEWSGKSYSERIHENTDRLAVRLEQNITDVVIAGKPPEDAKAVLENEFGMSYYQADRLIRTETSHVFNSANLENYKDAGIEYVEIIDVGDDRECEECEDIANQVYPINEAPMLPIHPNCRCTYVPHFEDV